MSSDGIDSTGTIVIEPWRLRMRPARS